jgi:predicted dienelactone hydrolase
VLQRSRLLTVLLFILVLLGFLRFVRRHHATRASLRPSTAPSTGDLSNNPGNEPVPRDECATNVVGYRVLTISGRPVALWYPTSALASQYSYSSHFSSELAFQGAATTVCGKKVPLVVFSHGDFGCGLQSVAVTEELARHGYVVAAPDHADAFLCHTVEQKGTRHPPAPQPTVFKPETWNETTFLDRRKDLEAVIAELLSDNEFQQIIDPQSIGAAGHSLGGYTVVGLVGGWPSWLDPRIRAVIAYSPYVMPFQVQKTLGNVHVPLMYQGGSLDVGITPFLQGERGAYAAANPPVYFLDFQRAAHLAWVNCGDNSTTASCLAYTPTMRQITYYSVAFFNHYLKNIPEPMLEKSNPALAEYKHRLD